MKLIVRVNVHCHVKCIPRLRFHGNENENNNNIGIIKPPTRIYYHSNTESCGAVCEQIMMTSRQRGKEIKMKQGEQ